ncbi:MAG TPA: M14 family metallopeptidase [Pyrinomonadaceae bacterium]|nr:M14 family metallopeptidase [Pyrinomonadaceae bacterium]
MRRALFFHALLAFLLFPGLQTSMMSQNHKSSVPPEWLTPAEKMDYRQTPRYAETIEYARRLDQASPLIKFQSFGRSGEGRELPLLIATEGETFLPEAARHAGKAVILIQACIHAGEPDGKDAGLALLRDIAITKTRAGLLKNLVVLFIPIYNVDGHERVSPYNRINQDGPAEMGWRTTGTYQNLNRDYMKADTPETRAWLALWNHWKPDLFIDCHVTDGADYRYNITYQHEHHAGVAASVLNWEKRVIDERVAPATESAGNTVSWYLEFIDNRDLKKGIRDFNGSPRFSTGYTPLRNRPGILIETHMLKPYRPRVIGTYDFLRSALAEVSGDPKPLLTAVREADEETIAAGRTYDPARRYPIDFELSETSVPYPLKAVEYQTEKSEVSGAQRVIFGSKPLDLTVPMYNDFHVKTAIAPPLYYIVPAQWTDVIQLLKAHGLTFAKTERPTTIDVESYRFVDVKWAAGPFEGRLMPSFKVEPVNGRREFPAGSAIVPLDQEGAKVAINLLEPQAPDSLVRWGFFNATFEQKEYAEDYVLEKLAREMLRDDPNLRAEYEKRLASDSAFAANPHARLQFFYRRSPYWDRQMNLYPVGRIVTPLKN